MALVGIVIGLPATLLALGDGTILGSLGALDSAPSVDAIRSALSTPDDGTLALTALQVLAWGVWVFLSISIVVEVIAQVRQVRPPRLPGLQLPQSAAHHLVSMALLLFIAAPLLAQAPAAAGAVGEPMSAAAEATVDAAGPLARMPLASAPVVEVAPAPTERSATVVYTVVSGDSLWSIATARLGAGIRYPEIATLNGDVLGDRPGFLRPGTTLQLPEAGIDPAAERSAGDAAYTVVAGDTLSAIAQEQLGEAARFPEIFDASVATIQPGGVQLNDPDVIDVGWTLTVPGPTSAETPRDEAAAPDPATVTEPAPQDPVPGNPAPDTSAPAVIVPTPSPPPPTIAAPEHAAPEPGSTDPTVTPAPAEATPEAADPATTADDSVSPAWLLSGLTGGGVILAGSLFLMRQRRRRTQARARRPGRTIPSPAPVLAPVEKSVIVSGAPAAPTVELMDDTLRLLGAQRTADGLPMPQLAAVQLTDTDVVLHLSSPDDLSTPWQGTPNTMVWSLRRADDDVTSTSPDTRALPAPYPLLVTIGASDTGDVWLLNCEDLTLTITGDAVFGGDVARYLAAEIACNPWSAGVTVDCQGIAEEIGPMNPDRIRTHQPGEDPSADVLAEATITVDRVTETTGDVATARASQAGPDMWPARMLFTDRSGPTDALSALMHLIDAQAGRTATSVVILGDLPGLPGMHTSTRIVLDLSSDGRLSLPHAGLDLVAVGLTSDEARGCAALLAHGEDLHDAPIPSDAHATTGWRSYADEAGALRAEHTLPRDLPAAAVDIPMTSILDGPDEEYVALAATTVEDLERLAPQVSTQLRLPIEDADPMLDADIAAWFAPDCDLPRLTLLGPVRARTRGVPVTKRKPFYTEALAYLALHPHGVTPAEFADAMSLSPTGARNAVHMVRDWLGVDPRTGAKFLPDAREAPGAVARGLPVYQLVGVLVDADLFRRLRVRGQARGTTGIDDLTRALSLVTGRPFDQQRRGGWAWLSDGDRIDEHMLCAVVDVAHLVATHSLRAGDLTRARSAAELAAQAGPYEEIPRLDLAAIATAEGRHAETDRILLDEICNRSDDGEPPEELSDRTEEIIAQRGWLATDKAAS